MLSSLQDHFGAALKKDYGDVPINTPRLKRHIHAVMKMIPNRRHPFVGIKCIHGHFMPLKYSIVRQARFVTWIREPIERLGSHYHYWRRTYEGDKSPALHRRVVEEDWSLERFCLGPEMRNMYSQFLWGFPARRFAFIGIVESFESEMNYFSRTILNSTAAVYEQNRNPAGDSYFPDPEFRKNVEKYHAKDVDLYRWAVQRAAGERQLEVAECKA